MSNNEQGKTDGPGSARLPYRRRRTRVASDKRISEDEFMAAAIGDVEWLRQTLRDQKPGEVNFDKNVSFTSNIGLHVYILPKI